MRLSEVVQDQIEQLQQQNERLKAEKAELQAQYDELKSDFDFVSAHRDRLASKCGAQDAALTRIAREKFKTEEDRALEAHLQSEGSRYR